MNTANTETNKFNAKLVIKRRSRITALFWKNAGL